MPHLAPRKRLLPMMGPSPECVSEMPIGAMYGELANVRGHIPFRFEEHGEILVVEKNPCRAFDEHAVGFEPELLAD